MNQMSKFKKQAGMTLIEVLSALAIGAILIVGGLSLFGSGSAAANSNQMISDVTAIRTAVKSMYLGQGTYGTNTNMNTSLVTGHKIPATWTGSGSTITNSFGGDVAVTSDASGSQFRITAGEIPQSVCVGAVPAASSGWNLVGTGATAAAALTAATNAAPISPTTAATLCSASTQFVAFVGN